MNPFKFFAQVNFMVLILILLPTILLLLPFWWVLAWVLERIFPGRTFFPRQIK